ncbi:MAG: hypothetical protein PHE59_00305 [Patescibacteria group bacterium]|nr:hypothetical protein [Patescibacteria group bacterium]MDD5164448.1 hypothetical protein [Patescibacteria group bacterium]MDD5534367.1 hypothetical protein [Patescibacteria group bacterium]
MKNQKQILSKLMNLDNKQADKYLSNFANEIKKRIISSKDNDKIFEAIDILREFVYKVPKQTIKIVNHIIHNPKEPKLIKNPIRFFYGKSHLDVVIKALELLDQLRYIYADGVLPILEEIILTGGKDEKNKAIEIVKHFTKYDFNVLSKSKIGYGAQRKILDYILVWSIEKQIENFDFIEVATQELLGSSVEGTTSGINKESQYTLTMHFGVVQPTDFLKNIRRETINLIFNLYKNVTDEQKKIRLVKILEEAVRTPINVVYSENVRKMIIDDAQYLLTIYREMLFKDGKLVGSIPVAEEIEKRFHWFYRSGKLDTLEARKLRKDILTDSFYSIFRLFAGDDIVFREEEGRDKAESRRGQAIDTKVAEIDDSNLNKWINTLNKVAEQIGFVADWQFNPFKMFLRKLAAKKPDIASTIFNDALDNNKPMKNLATHILDGFRDIGRLDLWDTTVEKIIDKQEINLISAIIYSLNINREGFDLSKEIREQDLILLEDIVRLTGNFTFLTNQEGNNWTLQYAIINALTRNFKRDPIRIEALILEMIQKYQEKKDSLVRELEFGIIRGGVDYSEFSKKGINLLKSLLVELDNLDWDAQHLLLNLGKKDIQIIFDIFWDRIEKGSKKRKGKKIFAEVERYQAIPYYFNDDLKRYLSTYPQFQVLIKKWLNKVTLTWSPYNWNIGHFLKKINSLTVVIKNMIECGDENNLTKAVQLMDQFEGGNIELSIEIIKKTKSKKNIGHIEGMLFSTGVVSGEDGIARVHEAKAETLKKYLNDGNKQVKKFAKKMIKSLKDSAKRERQRIQEEKQLRKVEFEG